jgi:parallel beta-helix repeat protein
MRSERRIWNGLLFAVLLTLLAFVNVGCVSAATTRYVNPGDSLQDVVDVADPGDTIIVRDGTYTENVEVNVANLTLRSEHGSAFTTVVAAVNSSDVFLVTANSVTITGFAVQNATSARGIRLQSVHHCTVSGNNASGNYRGIYLSGSSNNTLTDNTALDNYYGIFLEYSSNNNNLTGNTANSNSNNGIYLRDSCNNNTLTDNTVNSNNDNGIHLYSSSNNNLTGNTANSNGNGIYLDYSSTNTLTNNIASNNAYGIYLRHGSNNNNLTGNTASNNTYGIWLRGPSSTNTLTNNTASNNYDYGIYLLGSDTNNLTGNTVSNNNWGIYLESSSTNNLIYNNYFRNTLNAYDDGNNRWNITKTAGTNILGGSYLSGNYWSDYTGEDTDGDGLGDTPYDIPGGTNKDYLPLVAIAAPHIFDTGKGGYPSIAGTHNGTIKPNQTINVSKLYTYPCPSTGGHTKYVKIWRGSEVIAEKTWNGYTGDWHNISFNTSFTLYANETYNYTIRTGSYPQIIHEQSWNATGGVITCTDFVNINSKRHAGWIPAIRLY